MTAPVRGWVAAVACMGMAVAGMALVAWVFGYVLDATPDPGGDGWVPAPTCQPGVPVVTPR